MNEHANKCRYANFKDLIAQKDYFSENFKSINESLFDLNKNINEILVNQTSVQTSLEKLEKNLIQKLSKIL